MKMKIKGYYDAERSQYEAPAIDIVIVSPESLLQSGGVSNAFNEDFETDIISIIVEKEMPEDYPPDYFTLEIFI